MTDETPDHGPTSPNDLAVVQIVLGQMTLLEARLVHKLDENSMAARDRWRAHDAQHDDWEKALRALNHRLDDHLRSEERADLVLDARLGPLRTGAVWLAREWRTIAIAIAFAATWVLAAFEH